MKSTTLGVWAGVAGLMLGSMLAMHPVIAEDAPAAPEKAVELPNLPDVVSEGVKDSKEVAALKLELPKPQITGTPKAAPSGTTVDTKTLGRRRGAFLAPKDVTLVSLKKPAKISDDSPVIGDASMITDGEKDGNGGNLLEMAPGRQWVQIDLGAAHDVWAVIMWHSFGEPRVYRDIIVQVSDDPEFKSKVTTLFNNDQDNSSELGAGKDREYFDSEEGKLVDGKGVKGRYVRCYSKGNTSDAQNHYIEVEVWGKASK